jgi:hypothetical protein
MLNLIIPAVILATSPLASDEVANAPATTQLSSAEIGALLAKRDGLPSNCQILGNPCFVIRCDQPNPNDPEQWPAGLYDCSVLEY